MEGGGTQKRLFDVGWSDISQCHACQEEEGTEKHRLHHCPEWYEVRREIPKVFRKLEQKAKTSKKEWKWQRGIVEHHLSGSQWNRAISLWESGSLRSTRAAICQQKASRGTSPLTALCWETLASGKHVVGQWYYGALAWDVWLNGGRIRGSAHHQEGGVDSLLMSPQKSMWTHQDSCG